MKGLATRDDVFGIDRRPRKVLRCRPSQRRGPVIYASSGHIMGRYELDELPAICLRVGYADAVRLVQACLDAPDETGFDVVFATSGNTWRIWDLDGARTLVGFEPIDDGENVCGDQS